MHFGKYIFEKKFATRCPLGLLNPRGHVQFDRNYWYSQLEMLGNGINTIPAVTLVKFHSKKWAPGIGQDNRTTQTFSLEPQ